jgi:uncharacterized protein YgbK (DUF1537 family)
MDLHKNFNTVLGEYPIEKTDGIRKKVSRLLRSNTIKIIVLDDDPTGIQTVHGCLVLTSWPEDILQKAFRDDVPFFYILTNSRSLNKEEAEKINAEVVKQILMVNSEFGYKIIFISRSDSTLRGHFPLETDTIKNVLSTYNLKPGFPVIFTPAFFEAGRFTIDNVHYYKEGESLIPVNESEFANDNVFGYKHANLIDYIIEKTNNEIKPENILAFGLNELKNSSVDDIIQKAELNKSAAYIISNAWQYADLYKLALAVLTLAIKGKNPLILRTSSSFPKALSGIEDKPHLTGTVLNVKSQKGLFIIGSHVQKTTRQLNKILENHEVQGIEIPVDLVLNSPDSLLGEIQSSIKNIWKSGKLPVLFTSRKEVRLENKSERLNLGKKVSEFLVNIVCYLPEAPSYLVSKGGITSHDILTKGLKLKSARVAGQVLPGVPVILTGSNHKFSEMPFVIFPGNVGNDNSLAEIVEIFAI